MPTCKEGYVSEEINQLMGGNDLSVRRSVLQVALDLHMGLTGASERHPEDMLKDMKILQFYIDHWIPGSKKSIKFDASVKAIIEAALEEASSVNIIDTLQKYNGTY